MQNPRSRVRVGDSVHVRGQRWRVQEVRDYEQCTLITAAGDGPLNQGSVRTFLTPFDRVVASSPGKRAKRVDSRRWRRAVRALLAAHGPADALRTAAAAAIDLLPHQLEPAVAVLRGMGNRVLLADEVGLGKTIQAALVIAELRARGLADRVLVATPAGLRDQWREELSERFSIDASPIDARELRRRSALSPLGVNPWTTATVAIASVDFVKRPEVLPGALDTQWDVVVVDEAHGAGPQSDRHAAAASLCRRASYVLLLTATPHSGDRASFDALCRLGALGADDPLLVFRRTREDLSLGARRRIHRLRVSPSDAERLMHARLIAFARAVRAEKHDGGPALSLALGTLFKRAFSSPWSLTRSVERRLSGLYAGSEPSVAQAFLPFDAEGESSDARDEPPVWMVPALSDPNRERRFLEGMADAARVAVEADSKLDALRRLVRRLRRHGESAIVFTEYRDTLIHLQRALALESVTLHGGLTRDERVAAVSAFRKGQATLLLATDAAGEGLNLQATCRVVINLELPWNPNRLEQRAGRVDRIGQRRQVHAFHMIAAGEERILDRLKVRIQQARIDIESADPLNILDASSSESSGPLPALHTPPIDVDSERDRLFTVRRLLDHRDPVTTGSLDSGPLVAVAPGRLRATLRGRALALVRSVLEDSYGRPIAAMLVPAFIELAGNQPPAFGRDQLDRFVQQCGALVSTRQFEELAAWTTRNRSLHQLLIERRLHRDAVACSATVKSETRIQFGLFDRRAEHDAAAADDRLGLWRALMRDRSAQIERGSRVCRPVTRICLLLLS